MRTRLDIEQGIQRLQRRVDELKAFDPFSTREEEPAAVKTLETKIDRALEQTFGRGSGDYERLKVASNLQYRISVWYSGMPETPLREYQERTAENIGKAISLLEGAIASLEEDLADLPHQVSTIEANVVVSEPRMRRAFVVHGHDEAAKEGVARFLQKIDVEPVILHERASRGRTVIEKIEAHSDVSFAVVLLTPDDLGGTVATDLKPRARQNVLLELGYFIGKLKRENVCALRKSDVEIPTDFAGVVWVEFDSLGRWQVELAKELDAAGIPVDFNKALR